MFDPNDQAFGHACVMLGMTDSDRDKLKSDYPEIHERICCALEAVHPIQSHRKLELSVIALICETEVLARRRERLAEEAEQARAKAEAAVKAAEVQAAAAAAAAEEAKPKRRTKQEVEA